MGSSLEGDHTFQGGDRDGPNNLVWLHMEISGEALSALRLRWTLIAQAGSLTQPQGSARLEGAV